MTDRESWRATQLSLRCQHVFEVHVPSGKAAFVHEVQCPHCGSQLGFDEKLAGRKLQCPACREKLTIPKIASKRVRRLAWFHYVAWFLAAGCIFFAGFSIWLGVEWGLLITLVSGTLILSSKVGRHFTRWCITHAENWRQARRVLPSEHHLTAIASGQIEVESAGQNIPKRPPNQFVNGKTDNKNTSDNRTDFNSPRVGAAVSNQQAESKSSGSVPGPAVRTSLEGVKFYGPNEFLHLDRFELVGPLIYGVRRGSKDSVEPSLIDFALPVGRVGLQPGQEPDKWSTYQTFNPSQRSFYLAWLAEGRRGTGVPLPYPFLYVQGLERRIICDGLDHEAVASELLGLIGVSGNVFVFRRDLTSLLWLTIALSVDVHPVTREFVDRAIQETVEWHSEVIRYCLSTFAELRWSVTVELAMMVTAVHPQAVASVVHDRHPEKFKTLFGVRFREAFPNGLVLETGGRVERLNYVCLNPSLSRISRTESCLKARRRVAEDNPDLQKLVELWERATADLKSFDRAHRSASDGELTTEMWESLPEAARDQEHPEAERWSTLIRNAELQCGRPLIRISDLGAIKKFESCGRLTKKQTEQLLTTASFLKLAMEPDARQLGRNYLWNETVAVFPRIDHSTEDVVAYNVASILLRLGLSIAAADGNIDEIEVLRITSYLTRQFELSAISVARLEHLRYALIHSPNNIGTLEKSLQEKLNSQQLLVVGEFLVGIAAADGSIVPAELKALKKVWKALGLESGSLESLLVSSTPAKTTPDPESASETIVLDRERIAQIMRDTQKVAEILRSAMLDDSSFSTDPEGVSVPFEVSSAVVPQEQRLTVSDRTSAASQLSPRGADAQDRVASDAMNLNLQIPLSNQAELAADPWPGLPQRYHTFLAELLTQSAWDRPLLEQRARANGCMLGGALESINEWVYAAHNDWLTSEEGDRIVVQTGILTKPATATPQQQDASE